MTCSNHRPKRSLGQNFLQDQGTAKKIVAALGIQKDASADGNILEIGPGHGALTRWLRETKYSLHILEKDLTLAMELKSLWPEVGVIAMDALKFPWERLPGPWLIIGNLPYNVASPIIWDLVSRVPSLRQGVFMVQKEVADRLAAAPASRNYGALSVWVQSHVHVRRLFIVGPQVFHPRPKVDSAVVRFTPLAPGLSVPFGPDLRKTLNICFQQRRKQLKTILRPLWNDTLTEWIETQGLRPQSRPEELSPRQFQTLARMLFSTPGGEASAQP